MDLHAKHGFGSGGLPAPGKPEFQMGSARTLGGEPPSAEAAAANARLGDQLEIVLRQGKAAQVYGGGGPAESGGGSFRKLDSQYVSYPRGDGAAVMAFRD